jgi:hypothetical protein
LAAAVVLVIGGVLSGCGADGASNSAAAQQVTNENSSADSVDPGSPGATPSPSIKATTTLSSDGSQLTASQSGSLYTADGTWTFSGNHVMLNGVDTKGVAQLIQVSGGKLYQLSTSNAWWLWSGGAAASGWWSQTSAPPSPTSSQPPSNSGTGSSGGQASTQSPDGSQLTPNQGGSLITADGTWTFSGNEVMLNGVDTRGIAQLLQVDSGGKLYQLSLSNVWWVWSGGAAANGWWTQSSAPPTQAAGSQPVTLSWQAPTQNADGSTLTDLAGYRIHYGASSGNYTSTIQVANAGLTTYVISSLPSGTYYFAISAYNAAGVDGALSAEVMAPIN